MALYTDIKKNFILPDAYEDWTDYRNTVTDYIIRETNHVSLPLSFSANMDGDALLPTLAIIGAGACNDIDLHALIPHFSQITLIDYDESAMNTALKTYNLQDCPYVNCMTISLNGFDDLHYEAFCNSLQSYVRYHQDHMTYAGFEEYATALLDTFLQEMSDSVIPLSESCYDFICCLGVHSQLLSMFSYIYHAFEVNLRRLFFTDAPDFSARFLKRLQEENGRFIPLFHDRLLHCAKQAIFLGLEQSCTNKDGAIEGAYQAKKDIQTRNLILEETSMLWPFSPKHEILYKMSIVKITIPTEK